MFGYIKPMVSDLKVGDYGYYKAAYCGLCKCMGKTCGKTSRACLSYDMVFLMLVRSWLAEESTVVKKGRCCVNPVLRREMLEQTEEVKYASAVSGILASFRFEDGIADETGMRRFGSKCGKSLSQPWVKRADVLYPGLAQGIKTRLERLYERENSYKNGEDAGPAADECAGLFGEVLAYVCSYGLENNKSAFAIASAVGKYTGRWNYLVDACDDMAEDEKKKRFNPFLISYGKSELTEDEKTTLSCLLAAEAGAAADAFELSTGGEGNPQARRIIENILCKGMPDTSDKVISGEYRKPQRESV